MMNTWRCLYPSGDYLFVPAAICMDMELQVPSCTISVTDTVMTRNISHILSCVRTSAGLWALRYLPALVMVVSVPAT